MFSKIELENFKSLLGENNNMKFVGIKFNKIIHEKIFENKKYYIIGNDYENEIGIKMDYYKK